MTRGDENAGKLAIDNNSPRAIWRKGVNSYSILWQFCKNWVHKRCNGSKGKLKEDSTFKCQTCANKQTGHRIAQTYKWPAS